MVDKVIISNNNIYKHKSNFLDLQRRGLRFSVPKIVTYSSVHCCFRHHLHYDKLLIKLLAFIDLIDFKSFFKLTQYLAQSGLLSPSCGTEKNHTNTVKKLKSCFNQSTTVCPFKCSGPKIESKKQYSKDTGGKNV